MNKNRNSIFQRFRILRKSKVTTSIYHVLLFSLFVIGALVFHPATSSVSAQGKTSIEYKVKAAYLYKFFNFFEWKTSSPTIHNQQFTIGVIGNSPIHIALKNLLKDSDERKMNLKVIDPGDSLEGLHLLFISKSRNNSLQKVFQKSHSLSILTVGEEASFCQKGGAINFVIRNNKVKFEINRQAVKKAGIKASSRILKAALEVYP